MCVRVKKPPRAYTHVRMSLPPLLLDPHAEAEATEGFWDFVFGTLRKPKIHYETDLQEMEGSAWLWWSRWDKQVVQADNPRAADMWSSAQSGTTTRLYPAIRFAAYKELKGEREPVPSSDIYVVFVPEDRPEVEYYMGETIEEEAHVGTVFGDDDAAYDPDGLRYPNNCSKPTKKNSIGEPKPTRSCVATFEKVRSAVKPALVSLKDGSVPRRLQRIERDAKFPLGGSLKPGQKELAPSIEDWLQQVQSVLLAVRGRLGLDAPL